MKRTRTQSHVVLLGWQQPQAGTRGSPCWSCVEKAPCGPPPSCASSHSVMSLGGPRGHAHCFSPRTHSEHFPEAWNPLPQWPRGPLPQVHPPQGRPPCRGAPLDLGSGRGLWGVGVRMERSLDVQRSWQRRAKPGVGWEPALPISPHSQAELRTQELYIQI